ncbi:MAG: ABC transporter ATP-binding protein [Methanomicrobia archaeon]|nr:ABC transporter ATP-binding protein [Methanomicrobia archaeon]RLF94416.1 MAG: ABC transporter ATP-binding protein [Thermococci archaeon]RLG02104.1 MAG: ABC transporter ATP-binding protein [Thermococci archaeon]HDN81108.1 ABC transporter ATP-binding protein [Methanomicrobia archaeon]
MMDEILNIENLKAYFFTTRGAVKAVDDVSFTIGRKQSLGLAGESACGKSTLAFTILKMLQNPGRLVGGKMVVTGMDITDFSESKMRKEVRWKKISMVFQGAMNALNPVYTVGYQMAEPLMYHKGVKKEDAMEKSTDYLELVGLSPDILTRYPHELSGGMKQRVVIAMALLLSPDLVICDEPTTALDVVVQAQIMNLLKRLKKELEISTIFITHDLSILAEVVDRLAIMYAGKFVEIGDSIKMYRNPVHPYTQKLLGAIPKLHEDLEKLEYIPGTPPNLIHPPSGCRFHPRCPYAMDICKKEEPKMKEVDADHFAACHLL